jgi:hypothetical protein
MPETEPPPELFPPKRAPDPHPPLNPNRATLLRAIEHYLDRAQSVEPWDGVTHLEIQKLA